MNNFHRHPTPAKAVQWFRVGDHPQVQGPAGNWARKEDCESCRVCGAEMKEHGWTRRDEMVCPGNWIVEEDGELAVWADYAFRKCFGPTGTLEGGRGR